jgi:hypothetical protein
LNDQAVASNAEAAAFFVAPAAAALAIRAKETQETEVDGQSGLLLIDGNGN